MQRTNINGRGLFAIYDPTAVNDSTIIVECQTMMTYVSIKCNYPFETFDRSQYDILHIQLQNIIELRTSNNNIIWNKLGYSIFMFVDWLEACDIYLNQIFNGKNDELHTVAYPIFKQGIETILNILNNS